MSDNFGGQTCNSYSPILNLRRKPRSIQSKSSHPLYCKFNRHLRNATFSVSKPPKRTSQKSYIYIASKSPTRLSDFTWIRLEMALPGLRPFATTDTAAAASTVSSSEDPNKKIRKPYTISKSRESWTEPEHDKFLEALQLFDRDWKKIEAFIGSKTAIQIRSHAQKYFLKVQKNGTSEHLPPPRPKRKATHPYPQKASKNALGQPQVSEPLQSPAALLDTGYVLGSDPSLMLMNPVARAAASSPTNKAQTISFAQDKKGPGMANNSCSSAENIRKTSHEETTNQGNHSRALRVLPDFGQVYGFIGSIFDPNTNGHLQKLKNMDPIDVETVLLLMRNLSINLSNPDFEDHKRLLSSYEIDAETNDNGGAL